jgi:hypothetical protein
VGLSVYPRPIRSRFSVVFLDPRANAEFVPKLHVALHASHAALPMVTSKFRPNIALSTLAPILLMQPFQRHIYIYIYIYMYNKITIICVTYTRRTSGHCLGTFKTGDIVSCPPPPPCHVSHCLHNFLSLALTVCIPLQLQGNGSVNTFQLQGRIVGGVVFYVVRVLSKESGRILLKTSRFLMQHFLGNVILFFVVTADHREDFIAFSCCESGKSFRTTSHPQALLVTLNTYGRLSS